MDNEISIMKSLNCPHIPKLHDIYESSNTIALVLDLLRGGNLYDKIVKEEHISKD